MAKAQDKRPRPRLTTVEKIQEQARWRVGCIRERLAHGKFIEKNFDELAALCELVPTYVYDVRRDYPAQISLIGNQIAAREAAAAALIPAKQKKKAA